MRRPINDLGKVQETVQHSASNSFNHTESSTTIMNLWNHEHWLSCRTELRRLVVCAGLLGGAGCGGTEPVGGPGTSANPQPVVGQPAGTEGPSTSSAEQTEVQIQADLKNWTEMLESENYQDRLQGAAKFNRLAMSRAAGQASDAQAQAAVAVLKKMINDRWSKLAGVMESMSLSLIYLDGDGLEETKAILKEHTVPDIRTQVVIALGKRANPRDKQRYLGLFAQNDPKVETAVQTLIEVLRMDTEPDVREQAAAMLGYIGPEAKSALSALGDVMQNEEENSRVRVAAGAAAGKITEKPPQ